MTYIPLCFIHSCSHAAHILSPRELKVLSILLTAYEEQKFKEIKQSIQDGQCGNLSLAEVEEILRQSGRDVAANELRENFTKGTSYSTH